MIYYNRFNEFLKDKFGKRTLKICIDGGFSCPNRDGTVGCGGCTFCGEKGTGFESQDNMMEVEKQIEANINHIKKKYAAEKYIAYFQSFTNTYGDIEYLVDPEDESIYYYSDDEKTNKVLYKYNNRNLYRGKTSATGDKDVFYYLNGQTKVAYPDNTVGLYEKRSYIKDENGEIKSTNYFYKNNDGSWNYGVSKNRYIEEEDADNLKLKIYIPVLLTPYYADGGNKNATLSGKLYFDDEEPINISTTESPKFERTNDTSTQQFLWTTYTTYKYRVIYSQPIEIDLSNRLKHKISYGIHHIAVSFTLTSNASL